MKNELSLIKETTPSGIITWNGQTMIQIITLMNEHYIPISEELLIELMETYVQNKNLCELIHKLKSKNFIRLNIISTVVILFRIKMNVANEYVGDCYNFLESNS